MPLEVGTWIQDLVASNPPGSDSVSQGDDHLRLVKSVLQNTFPNSTKAFRFPNSVAAATGTVTVAFPADHNKLFPVNAAGGAITVNLPDPTAGGTVNEDGFTVMIVKSDTTANVITVTPAGGQTINGGSSLTLTKPNQTAFLQWSKANATWYFSKLGSSFAAQNIAVQTKSANYTLQLTDDNGLIEVNTLPWTLTLPVTGLYSGFRCRVKIISATSSNALTVSSANNIYVNRGDITGTVLSFRMFGFGEIVELEWDGSVWLAHLLLSDGETIGTIKTWMKETAPSSKWVLLHSTQTLNRTTYSELFALWGTIFGTGDGSTTFGIPNFAGYALRAWNNGAGIDPDAATRTDRGDGTGGDHIGTKQQDDFKTHNHSYVVVTNGAGGSTGGAPQDIYQTTGSTTGNAPASGGNESRGKNIAVGMMLKVLP